MEYFFKIKINQKPHDEQNINSLNKDGIINNVIVIPY